MPSVPLSEDLHKLALLACDSESRLPDFSHLPTMTGPNLTAPKMVLVMLPPQVPQDFYLSYVVHDDPRQARLLIFKAAVMPSVRSKNEEAEHLSKLEEEAV